LDLFDQLQSIHNQVRMIWLAGKRQRLSVN